MEPTAKPDSASASVFDTAVFFVAGLMSLCFLISPFGVIGLLLGATFVTAMRTIAYGTTAAQGRGARVLRRLAWLGNACFHLFAVYLTIIWISKLSWTMPAWTIALATVALLAAAATLGRPRGRSRVPILLPLGIVILTCLIGWRREEGFARCDDYRRVTQQSDVHLVAPTSDELTACRPGSLFAIRRYPRKLWESPQGDRYVVTTTSPLSGGPRAGAHHEADRPAHVYDALFCEVASDGSGRPRCVGGEAGKSHQFDVVDRHGQLFACAWGLKTDDGRKASAIFRLSQSSPLTVLEEHRIVDSFVMYGFYQPASDDYHAFTDECGPVLTFRGSDLSQGPDLPIANCPGATIYDASRDEGVMCGGLLWFAAFKLNPWSLRPIARAGNPLGRLWMSWGCEYDPIGRTVYALVPNLGLLANIDYDTGRVRDKHFVGFALRSVVFDDLRGLVYMSDFLAGDVIALDPKTGTEVKRWFAGRFLRELRLSRDGRQVLTASNLGIVRIDLPTARL